jgi:hypothetical protein
LFTAVDGSTFLETVIDGNELDVIMVDVLGLTATGPFPHRVSGIGPIL